MCSLVYSNGARTGVTRASILLCLHQTHMTGKDLRSNMCLKDDEQIAARALATYFIPGCVESSSGSGGAGGVWKSGNLEI